MPPVGLGKSPRTCSPTSKCGAGKGRAGRKAKGPVPTVAVLSRMAHAGDNKHRSVALLKRNLRLDFTGDWRMQPSPWRLLLLVCALAVALGLPALAPACPFCSMQGQTLTGD